MERFGDPQAQRSVDDILVVFKDAGASTEQLRAALGAALNLYAEACMKVGDLLLERAG